MFQCKVIIIRDVNKLHNQMKESVYIVMALSAVRSVFFMRHGCVSVLRCAKSIMYLLVYQVFRLIGSLLNNQI